MDTPHTPSSGRATVFAEHTDPAAHQQHGDMSHIPGWGADLDPALEVVDLDATAGIELAGLVDGRAGVRRRAGQSIAGTTRPGSREFLPVATLP